MNRILNPQKIMLLSSNPLDYTRELKYPVYTLKDKQWTLRPYLIPYMKKLRLNSPTSSFISQNVSIQIVKQSQMITSGKHITNKYNDAKHETIEYLKRHL